MYNRICAEPKTLCSTIYFYVRDPGPRGPLINKESLQA
jgi:hypothetical protein